MLKTTFLISAVALAGCVGVSGVNAEMSEKAQAKLAQFEKTGETENCLNLRRVDHIKPLDSKTFLVEARGGKFYLNEVNGKCSGAGRPGNALSFRTSLGSICKGEIVRVFDTSADFTMGSCSLGKFQELTKKEPAEG